MLLSQSYLMHSLVYKVKFQPMSTQFTYLFNYSKIGNRYQHLDSQNIYQASHHRRAPLSLQKGHKRNLEREKFLRYRVRNRNVPTVVSGWVLARTNGEYPSPFPPLQTILRKAQISHIANLHTSMVLSLLIAI